jgi:orotate phosphoribosyltransferase-like protein
MRRKWADEIYQYCINYRHSRKGEAKYIMVCECRDKGMTNDEISKCLGMSLDMVRWYKRKGYYYASAESAELESGEANMDDVDVVEVENG